ncbi:MAG TPA: hypothetical protein VLB27_01905, partial [candidate division Zixibacteria bacterium]|nr:hypothetical protein [candidate division Zixibacteria bacterium]
DVFPPDQQEQIRMQLSITLQGVISQALLPKIGGGRVAAHEIMIATGAVRASIREGKTPQLQNVLTTGSKFGMQTLEDCLVKLAQSGVIEAKIAVAKANNHELVRKALGLPENGPVDGAAPQHPGLVRQPAGAPHMAPPQMAGSQRTISR